MVEILLNEKKVNINGIIYELNFLEGSDMPTGIKECKSIPNNKIQEITRLYEYELEKSKGTDLSECNFKVKCLENLRDILGKISYKENKIYEFKHGFTKNETGYSNLYTSFDNFMKFNSESKFELID